MALYHKYRPQIFADVIGQDHIVQTLVNQIVTNKLAHAYLFSGSRGIGKTSLARILAKAANCENRKENDSEPCNKCGPCTEISASHSIDVIEIDAASHTGVDNVRENIIDNAQFKPTKSKFKIFIIDEVHMLSTSAFNALLKTLEEPPAHVIFILATTELHKLPETIISRCQRFEFKKVPYQILEKFLKQVAKEEKIKIEPEVIDRIIRKSEGCVRDAVSLLDQLAATGEKEINAEIAALVLPNTSIEKTLELIKKLFLHETKSGLEYLNQLAETGVNLNQFLIDLVDLLRNIMISKVSGKFDDNLDLPDKTKKELTELAGNIELINLLKLIDLLLLRGQQIKTSPLPQLPLELAVIEWCNSEDTRQKTKDINSEKIPEKKADQKKTEILEFPKKTLEIIKPTISDTADFNIEDATSKWGEFISRIEKNHPSLSFILKMAQIVKVEGNILKLTVQYSFHQDKLMENTIRRNLEEILSELMAVKVKLEVLVNDQQKINNSELNELASAIGGEVVN